MITLTIEDAMKVAEDSSKLETNNNLDVSGCHIIWEGNEYNVAVYIRKVKDSLEKEFYEIEVSYSDGGGYFEYTNSLNKEELIEKLFIIASEFSDETEF